jgi:hypothetical protein
MAATRPLPHRQLTLKSDQLVPKTGAQIIDLSAYFALVGSQHKPGIEHQKLAERAPNYPHKLQGKAVRFFQGQEELHLTNKQ